MPQPRKYESEAARKRAYRARRKARELAEAAALLGSDDRAEAVLEANVYTLRGREEPMTPDELAELESHFVADAPSRFTPARRGGLISWSEREARLSEGEYVLSLNMWA